MGSPGPAISSAAPTNGDGVVPLDTAAGSSTGTETPATPRTRWGPALVLTFVGTATIGFNDARVAGFPLADVIFLVAAGVVALQLLMGNTRHLATSEMRRAPVQLVAGSLVLLGAGIWSTLWVEDPGASVIVLLRFAWLTLVWSWLLRSVAANRLALDRLIEGYRVAVWLNAALAVAGDFGLVHLVHGESGRQMAYTAHPNHLGGLLAVGLPFVLLDTRTTKRADERPWSRTLTFRLLSGGFVVYALTTTGSMSALGAAVGGVVAMGVVSAIGKGKPRRRNAPLVAITVSLVVMLGVAGLVASGAPTIERLIGFSEGDSGVSGSVESRGEQDGYVIDNIDRFLVTGAGFAQGEGEVKQATGHGVHNNVLKIIFEAGIPAAIGLIMLWLLAARQGWRLLFNTRGTALHTLVVALLGSFVTASFFAQFHPLAYERYYWYPLVMIGALWSLRRHELGATRYSTNGNGSR